MKPHLQNLTAENTKPAGRETRPEYQILLKDHTDPVTPRMIRNTYYLPQLRRVVFT
jgi:hypothetical protein